MASNSSGRNAPIGPNAVPINAKPMHRNSRLAAKLRWPTTDGSSRNGKSSANATRQQDEMTITRLRPNLSAFTQEMTMNAANTQMASISMSRYSRLVKPRSPPPCSTVLVPQARDQVASV